MPQSTSRSMKRVEDEKFLAGAGSYCADIKLADEVFAVFVRSPYAHATITGINIEDAVAADGILGVFTQEDIEAGGISDVPCLGPVDGVNGTGTVVPANPLLARGKVNFVGDAVALVIGETLDAARDAAELVMVDYDELASVNHTGQALDPASAQVWPEAPGNLGIEWECGDRDGVAAAFAGAAETVELTVINNRVAVCAIEPRSAIGEYDAQSECFTLTTPCQGVFGVRWQIAEHVLNIPPEKLRIVTPDVGGAFGARFYCNREQITVLWAARQTGRCVRWIADRSECFFADGHGRDHINTGALALDADGRILALRLSTVANMGAHMKDWGPSIPTAIGAEVLTGPYDIALAHANIKCVFTNMVPIDAYRGVGRAEIINLLERLIDAAARKLGLPRDELRRRNFVKPAQMPYTTVSGQVYDSGRFEAVMEDAMARADWQGIGTRRQAGLADGKLIGIGMSSYIMSASGIMDEHARLRLDEDGGISAYVGTQSSGQGHKTVYTQIIMELFGLEADKIRVFQGDTQDCEHGTGTGQSRSLLMGGLALRGAAKILIEKASLLAGQLLQAPDGELAFDDGAFCLGGTGRKITLAQIAKAAASHEGPNAQHEPALLVAAYTEDQAAMTFPHGCHICELAVDADTGTIEIINYTSSDDFGALVNPMLCEGQVHGGVVQGIGQALMEQVAYEQDSGQLLSGSFMDYCLPRADNVPLFSARMIEDTPCLTNAMGVKGSGEAGAIAAPPAVINALIDALSAKDVTDIDMPATPDKVWRAIHHRASLLER